MWISRTDLLSLLNGVDPATPVVLVARTVPAMKKRGNPYFGNLIKLARVSGLICWDYEKAVNYQRLREGLKANFKAKERQWGKHPQGSPIVTHNGRSYLQILTARTEFEYVSRSGEKVDSSAIEQFLRVGTVRQGVKDPIIVRDYAIDNLVSLSIGEETYEIREILIANND